MKWAFLLFLWASQGHAALVTPSVDSAWIASASSAAQAITTAFTTGSGSNRVMFVLPGSTTTLGHGGYNQVSSVSFNGQAFTFVSLTYAVSGSLYIGTEVWRLINPPASTTANVIVNYSIATGDQNGYVVGQYKDVDQTTPIGTVAKVAVTASPATVSFSSTYSSAALVCGVDWYAGNTSGVGGSAITFDAGLTKRAEVFFATSGNDQAVGNRASTQASVSNTWGTPGAFSGAGQIVFEVVPVQPLAADSLLSPYMNPCQQRSNFVTPKVVCP